MENNRSFNANGILWSSSKDYYKEILMELAKKCKIEKVSIYDLKDNYSNFIIDCYQHDEDVMSDGYIDEKIDRLLQDNNTEIVAFTMIIDNPQYKYDKKGNLQCIQARNIKELLRRIFSKKINNYFLDNIIHVADSPEESKILEKVFNKYKTCVVKEYRTKSNNNIQKECTDNKLSTLDER